MRRPVVARPGARTLGRRALLAGGLGLGAAAAAGCVVPGEQTRPGPVDGGDWAWTLNIDYATYNPLSLVIRAKGWLDEALNPDDVGVHWVFSAGSNKANENLRAEAIEVGSTAGSAALLSRANGTPIRTIAVANRPEWAALVRAPGSDVDDVAALAGSVAAATRGNDPYFFLVQALREFDVPRERVEILNLQHADGRTALFGGSVQAWSGLDPIMADAQRDGAELFYRNLAFNTFDVLNATQRFLDERPEVAQTVVDVYQQARAWVLEGSVLGLSRWADALLSPTIGALRAVPSLAWVPLLILWMQIGEESKVTLIAIGAFFPVFTTVYAALRHVDPHLVEAGRAYGYHGVRLLGTVQLPAVVPAMFSGLRLALAQAWLFLVAAELIASSMGLGFLLTDSQNNGRTDRLILAIILLAVLGKISDWLLGFVERWAVRRWA